MAEASYWMAFAALGTMLITAIGTAFLAWQVNLTRKAVKDTGDATKAMVNSNEMSEALQRPWVTIECVVDDIFLDGAIIKIHLRLIIKNIGKTVAKRVRHETLAGMEYGAVDGIVQNWFKSNRSPKMEASTLMPSDSYEIKVGGDFIFKKSEAMRKGSGFIARAALTYSMEGKRTVFRTQMAFAIGVKEEGSAAMDDLTISPNLANGDYSEDVRVFRFTEGLVT